jgi:hypothetical protein
MANSVFAETLGNLELPTLPIHKSQINTFYYNWENPRTTNTRKLSTHVRGRVTSSLISTIKIIVNNY